MSKQLKEMLARAAGWSPELQEEALQTLLTLEEQGTGIFHIDDDQWAEMQDGLAQAKRGEFISDKDVAQADKRLGL